MHRFNAAMHTKLTFVDAGRPILREPASLGVNLFCLDTAAIISGANSTLESRVLIESTSFVGYSSIIATWRSGFSITSTGVLFL